MATNEALFSVSMKTKNGTILTLRADDFETFSTHIADAVGAHARLSFFGIFDGTPGDGVAAHGMQILIAAIGHRHGEAVIGTGRQCTGDHQGSKRAQHHVPPERPTRCHDGTKPSYWPVLWFR